MNVALIVPTLNAQEHWPEWVSAIKKQKLNLLNQLIIDSASSDATPLLAKQAGFAVHSILRQNFNHGGTRQLAIALLPAADIIIFLTQDAILANDQALEKIIDSFKDSTVGAVYGRQLPQQNSGPLGAHARLFNYQATSRSKSLADVAELGIKTAFISNSFAAYRREALLAVGGFPQHTILGEDTCAAAKMILAGWKIAYCAEAQVYHSHDYNFLQEFKRYFDTGVFHSREAWIREKFGAAEGEGLKFVLSEANYLIEQGAWYLLPSAVIRTCLKYLGYQLGRKEQLIPNFVKKKLSMNSRYWD